MAKISIIYALPFVSVSIYANDKNLVLPNVLLDTGSAATIFKTDTLKQLGISWEMSDPLRFMVGVGGREAVVEKQIQALQVEDMLVRPFTIQMGALDYNFPLDGILGLNFLHLSESIIDFKSLELRKG